MILFGVEYREQKGQKNIVDIWSCFVGQQFAFMIAALNEEKNKMGWNQNLCGVFNILFLML